MCVSPVVVLEGQEEQDKQLGVHISKSGWEWAPGWPLEGLEKRQEVLSQQ